MLPLVQMETVSRRPAVPTWALAVVGVWLALVIAAMLLQRTMPLGDARPLCLVRQVTGVPCPTCGTTRAVKALAQGDVFQAFAFNPLVVIGGGGAAIVLLIRLVFARQLRLNMSAAAQAPLIGVLVLIVLVNWAYVIAQHELS